MSDTHGPMDLNRQQKAEFIIDMFTRIMVHHGMWFAEVRHQMGMEKALPVMDQATKNAVGILMKHLSRATGMALENGMPQALAGMADAEMDDVIGSAAKSWLANDGVWFQAVEFSHGMNDAKRCNDSCWTRFSPYEAHAVKQILGLSKTPGLDGLKKALNFRMYAVLNQQSIVDEGPKSFVFQMNNCRVQAARQRKNLADYPCKSAGLVEYTSFAEAVDPAIKTECIGCPPDDHPDEWFCAWRFYTE
jgi:hypothetical protein